jgi:hypothetical protein
MGVVQEVDRRVGGLDAGRLRAGDAVAVVGADGVEDAGLEERLAGEDLSGVRVVDPEALVLQERAPGADRVLARDRVELRLAEGQGHDELAEVVQQAGQVRRLDIGSGALGQGACDGGHLAGMHVQQPARRSAGARGELEEAAHGSLEGEPADAHAPDEGDGLADGLRADGARAGRGVREAQDVGGQPGVGLERGDELVGVGLGVAGELADASQGAVEHRQLADALDGVLEPRVDGRGMSGRGVHRPAPIVGSNPQELSGSAAQRTVIRAGYGRREPRSALWRLGGRRGGGAGGRLVCRAALGFVDLGRDHHVLLTNTRVGWMPGGDTSHPCG